MDLGRNTVLGKVYLHQSSAGATKRLIDSLIEDLLVGYTIVRVYLYSIE